jgi:glycosyltransferase involved in cell wall biosynthesis
MDAGTKTSVAIIMYIPSPYQVELFDAIAAMGSIEPTVVYVRERDRSRHWYIRDRRHRSLFLQEDRQRIDTSIAAASLVVFAHYQSQEVRRLMRLRHGLRRPWCFWGERPGFRYPGFIGRLYRAHRLHVLRSTQTPIWGIGNWAIQGYSREFGAQRSYFNVPYFSDLSRFARPVAPRQAGARTFLYSGSLIARKGVDLLASAFRRLAVQHPDVRLELIGTGRLLARLRGVLASVSDQVCFHGFKQWHELPPLYRTAHILCAPSRYDGWGLVVPEGLAAGLPVIGTARAGAAIELLRPGRNGWIIPADDERPLYEAMLSAAALSEDELAEMSRHARLSVAAHTLRDGVRRFEEAVTATIDAWRADAP